MGYKVGSVRLPEGDNALQLEATGPGTELIRASLDDAQASGVALQALLRESHHILQGAHAERTEQEYYGCMAMRVVGQIDHSGFAS